MPIDSAVTQPLTSQAILALVAALGLSTTAGLRAVATLFAIGLVSDITVVNGAPSFEFYNGTAHAGIPLLGLTGSFQVLGDWRVLILLGVLTIVEIVVDKFPILDHLNDLIHTFIRPIVGAVVVAGTANSLSDTNVWVAAIVGAILAFGVHVTKTTTRAAATATTAGIGNPVLSTGEDVLAVAAILLVVLGKALAIALASPWIGITLLVIVLVVALALIFAAWRITIAIVRFFRGGSAPPAAHASAAVAGDAPRGLRD